MEKTALFEAVLLIIKDSGIGKKDSEWTNRTRRGVPEAVRRQSKVH